MTIWDRRWVRQWKRADEKDMEKLLKDLELRYFASIRQFLLIGSSISREDGEDLLQDLRTRVFQRGSQLKDNSNLRAWLYAIARNLLINHLTRKKDSGVDWTHWEDTIPGLHPGPEELLLQKEQQDFVENSLDTCSCRERQAAFLYYYEQMKVAGIAEVMDVAPGTVKSMLHRVRLKLKECWHETME